MTSNTCFGHIILVFISFEDLKQILDLVLSVAAHTYWNSLPGDVKPTGSIMAFQHYLNFKTYFLIFLIPTVCRHPPADDLNF